MGEHTLESDDVPTILRACCATGVLYCAGLLLVLTGCSGVNVAPPAPPVGSPILGDPDIPAPSADAQADPLYSLTQVTQDNDDRYGVASFSSTDISATGFSSASAINDAGLALDVVDNGTALSFVPGALQLGALVWGTPVQGAATFTPAGSAPSANPGVALNDAGTFVEVHGNADGSLAYDVGALSTNGVALAGGPSQFGTAGTPAANPRVGLNAGGQVVEVHEQGGGLASCTGSLTAASTGVSWNGCAPLTSTGSSPSVAVSGTTAARSA